MSRLVYFLKLIRLQNLSIIILMQVAIKFFLINSYLNYPSLSNYDFSLYLFSLITIVAAGYIINDIYDVEIDRINKPAKRIIEKIIKKKTALRIYYILNILGLTIGFYIAYQVNKVWLGFMFMFFAYNLFKYSKEYKTKFAIGNIQIAFLIALSIINLALFDLNLFGINTEDGTLGILYIILIYSAFAFIITLIREIIKDIEDIKGDKELGANTLAINYGGTITKKITFMLTLIPITGVAYFQYFQYNTLTNPSNIELSYWGVNKIGVIYTLLLQILMVTLLIKKSRANTITDFHLASTLCKIIMIIGILAIPLFNLLHQN